MRKVYVTLLALIFFAEVNAQVSRTPWQKHDAGYTATEQNTPINMFNEHGHINMYNYASIPASNDPLWTAAPLNGSGNIQFSQSSRLPSNHCVNRVDFTYFQTILTIPSNVTVTNCTVGFDAADDGVRAYVFNSTYPGGTYLPGSEIKLGQGTVTANIGALLKSGEDNRIVLVQGDDCPGGNNLTNGRISINGVNVTNISATALNFDGLNDFVEGTNNFNIGTSNVTIETWINIQAYNPYAIIIGKDRSGIGNNQFRLYNLSNGKIEFVMAGSGVGYPLLTSSSVVPLNTWTHVAVVREGTVCRLYINGILENSVTASSVANHNDALNWRIGSRYPPGSGTGVDLPFAGSMDEVRIWRRALCQGELQSTRGCEFNAPQSGLVTYYKLNHGYIDGNNAGFTTATDASGNGYHGTLNNFALTGSVSNWVAGTITGTCTAFTPPVVSIAASGPTTFCADGSVVLTASGATSYLWSTGATTASITVNTTGTYTVTGTTQGCSNNASTSVTVLSANPISISASAEPICAGQTTTLTASGDNSAGYALQFNGNNYAFINRTIVNDFTIEAWIKTTDPYNSGGTQFFQGAGLMYADVGGLNIDFGTSVLNGKFAFGTGGYSDQTIKSTTTISDGTWHHVAAVRQSGILRIYVDGVLEATQNTGYSGPLSAPATITMGGNTVDGRYYTGQLDEMRVWNVARTAAEVQSTLHTTVPVNTTGLSGYWRFNEGSGNSAVDISPTGNTGTLINNPTWVTSTAPIQSTYLWSPSTGLDITNGAIVNASPTSTTTYTVTGTNANGCTSMATKTVTVNLSPAASITANGPITFCQGGSVKLTASSGMSYLWSNGASDQTITVSTPGSYTVTVTQANGCSATSAPTTVSYTTGIDTDVDGMPDACDADDDNDGITDVSECNSSNFYWSNAPTESGFTATGVINGVNYTYTSTQTVLTTLDVFAHNVFPTSYNIPNIKCIQNINASNNTLTFASPISNPVLVFSSIGGGPISVPIEFSNPVEVLWSTAVVQNTPTRITGTEGYAIVRLNGVFSSISFNYLTSENYVNFLFGADFQTCGDTDGDGTPDYLDTDSDNDGCSDAIEGSKNSLQSQVVNGRLTGGIDANGVPLIVSGGQGIGTSKIASPNCFCQPGIDKQSPTLAGQNVTVQLDSSGNASIVSGQTVTDIFVEDFNLDPDGVRTTLSNWNFTQGGMTVDVGEYIGGNGSKEIDLAGNNNARIITKQSFDLVPGEYKLTFDNRLNNNPSGGNSVRVTIGSLVNQTFVSQTTTTNESVSFTVTTPVTVTLDFEQLGANDAAGSFIGNIRLSRVINPSYLVFVSAADDCGIDGISVSQSTFDCSNIGANPVVLTVRDINGNETQQTVIVTVQDNISPTISCPSPINVVATSAAGAVVNYTAPVGTDNCAGATTAMIAGFTSGATFPIGTTVVTYEVKDIAGLKAKCSFNVTVSGLAPVISCPANITVNNTPGQCGANVSFSATETTGIPASTITYSHQPGDFFPVGTTTVIATATNAVGSSSCTFTVMVIDNQVPVIANCPTNMTFVSPLDDCGYVVTWPDLIASDNCSVTITQTAGIPSGHHFPIGTTTNIFVATDASGNTSAVCSFTVTVEDRQGPQFFNCPADIIATNQTGQCGMTVNWSSPFAFDNCYNANITLTQTAGLASGSLFPVGTTIVTYTATDPDGNSSTCSFTVTVTDNERPGVTCPSNQVLNLGATCSTALPDYRSLVVANDNCTALSSLVITQSPAPGTIIEGVGDMIVSFTVTDQSGNSSTCNITVSKRDITPPVFDNCPSSIVVSNTPNSCDAVVFYTMPTATDNCAIATSGAGSFSQGGNGAGPTPNCNGGDSGGGGGGGWYGGGSGFVYSSGAGGSSYTIPSATNVIHAQGVRTGNGTITLSSVSPAFSQTFNYTGAVQSIVIPGGVTLLNVDVYGAQGGGIGGGMGGRVQANIIVTPGETLNIYVGGQGSSVGSGIANGGFNGGGNSGTCGIRYCGAGGGGASDIRRGSTFSDRIIVAGGGGGSHPINSTSNAGGGGGLFGGNVSATGNGCIATYATGGTPTAGGVASTSTGGCCTMPVTTSVTSSHPSGSTFPIGITTVTITATDAAGNTSTCSFDIIVTDNQLPVITHNGDKSVFAESVKCDAAVAVSATATDNCTIGAPTGVRSDAQSLTAPYPVGTTTITWNITDANDNAAIPVVQTITITDNQSPVLSNVPANITVSALQSNCLALVGWPAATADDNCGISSISTNDAQYNQFGFTLLPVGTHTIVYTATDIHNNSTTASFTVTVVDDQDPIITGCPAGIDVNTSGACEKQVFWSQPTASDNCPGVSMTGSHVPGDVFPVGTTTVTYTATDASGNVTTCSFDVTVTDNEPPVVSNCPSDITVNTGSGNTACSQIATWTAPTATDNCGVITVTSTHQPGATFPVGTTNVTYTFTDDHSNVSICSFRVTVIDNTPPVPNVTDLTTITAECSASAAVPTATDNCGGLIDGVPSGPTSFSTQGTHTITWTYTDGAGNASSQTQTVVIDDNTAPVIACPFNIEVNATPGMCGAVVNYNQPSATDNCGDGTLPTSLPGYTYKGTFGGHTYFVSNNQATPEAAHAAAIALGGHLATITSSAENAFVSAMHSDRMWIGFTDRDNEGTYRWVTNEPITYTNWAGGEPNNAGDEDWAVINWTGPTWNDWYYTQPAYYVVEFEGGAIPTTLMSGPASGSVFPVGTTTVTYSATDAGGNTVSCSFTVTVKDIEPPKIGCPGNINAIATSAAGATVNYTVPVGTDNCSGSTTVMTTGLASGSTFPIGTTTVTYRVTDAAGLSAQCSFTVTVVGVPPVIVCPSDIIVNNTTGACGTNVSFTATETTAIPASTITYSHQPGSFFDVGTTTVTATATNAVGTSVCTFTITVNDTEVPVLVNVPSDATVECTAVPSAAVVTATDNCPDLGNVGYTEVKANGNCAGNYTLTRTWTVTDAHGNTTSATQVITVQDTQSPSITAQSQNATVECDGAGNTSALATWLSSNGGATATDACSNVTWSNNFTSLSDDCGATGTATVVFTATDDCGNNTSTTATFTIVDQTAPVVIKPATSAIVECDGAGNTSALATWLSSNGGASATDVCSNVTWSNNFTSLSDDCGATGTATVVFTATDDCGNNTSTTATFTIVDQTAPTITAQSQNATVECDGAGNTSALAAWLSSNGGATASDVCSNVTWSNNFASLSDDCGATGTATVVFTATDDCGNNTSTTATFTIVDQTAPSITAPSQNATVECDGAGNTSALAAWLSSNGGATASDVCSNVTWSNNFASLSDDCGATGTATVVFTATDDCGNATSTTATFTIVDQTAPSITAQSQNATVECDGAGNTSALAAWLSSNGGATATDACSNVTWSNNFTSLSDDCGATGTATVVFTATDDCGNATSTTATFTIVDKTAPVITDVADVTVNCQDNKSPSATGSATATDVCSGVTITYSDVSTQNNNANNAGHYNYTITRTWTATDACNNSTSSVQVITVQDVTAPVAKCKPITITLVNGTASITTAQINNGSTDNCSPLSYSLSKSTFSCSDLGSNTVTLTVTDVSGNSSTCTATVTVVGEIPTCSVVSVPTSNVYTGGNVNNLYLGYGAQSTTLKLSVPASGAPYTYSWSGNGTLSSTTVQSPLFAPTAAGTYTFTVFITNKYGCTTTCTISICVTDIRVMGKKGGAWDGKKVYVCHVPPGNPGNAHTLEISVNAVPAHIGPSGHATDRLGKCEVAPCTAPTYSKAPVNTGVKAVEALTVKLSPNPTTNYFMLQVISSDRKTPVTVRVMNALGKMIETQRGSVEDMYRFGGSYINGTYFVEVIQGENRKVVQGIKAN